MTYSDAINVNGVVLVEFYASWCPHCKRMMPVVEQVRELLADKVAVYQFDIDENQATADAQGVKSIPTFIIYKSGLKQWRHTGEVDGEALLGRLESALG